MAENTANNLVALDLASFSRADLAKIEGLGDKMRLLYRWFRMERRRSPGRDECVLYSGARGPAPYACYRIARRRDGRYELRDHRSGALLAGGRTLDEVLAALPEDFYYTG